MPTMCAVLRRTLDLGFRAAAISGGVRSDCCAQPHCRCNNVRPVTPQYCRRCACTGCAAGAHPDVELVRSTVKELLGRIKVGRLVVGGHNPRSIHAVAARSHPAERCAADHTLRLVTIGADQQCGGDVDPAHGIRCREAGLRGTPRFACPAGHGDPTARDRMSMFGTEPEIQTVCHDGGFRLQRGPRPSGDGSEHGTVWAQPGFAFCHVASPQYPPVRWPRRSPRGTAHPGDVAQIHASSVWAR